MQRHAALDPLVSRKLGELLRYQNFNNDNASAPSVLQLQVGDAVSYIIGRKIAASGTLTFVGGKGLQTRYGNIAVGCSKILLKMEKVHVPSAKPPMQMSICPKNYTLRDTLRCLDPPVIVVRSSLIEKQLKINSNSFEPVAVDENLTVNIVNQAIDEIAENASQNITSNMLSVLPPCDNVNPLQAPIVDIEDDVNDDSCLRSRVKEDMFHRFRDIPCHQGCPIK